MDTELLNATYDNCHPAVLVGKFTAKVVKVYDADTLTLAFRSHPNSTINRYQIRVCYFDSAEIKSHTSVERKLARMARDFVHDLVFNKLVILDIIPANDKYGRILGRILYEDSPGVYKNLSDLILEKSLANPYDGLKKSDFTKLIEFHKLNEEECLKEEALLKSSKSKHR